MGKKIKMKDLKALAVEMNDVMGLDPEIDPDDYDRDELEQAILDNTVDEKGNVQILTSDYNDGETDAEDGESKFSDDAWDLLTEKLGVEPSEEVGEGEEPEPESEPEKKKPVKKADKPEKKKPVKKSEKSSDKPVKKPTTKKSDKPASAPKAKFTRFDGVTKAIQSGVKNIEKLTAKADELYVKHGGKSNMNEAKWSMGITLRILRNLELAKVADGKLTIL